MTKKFKLRDIILMGLIAIILGVVYWVLGPVYSALQGILLPFGLSPAANDLLTGVWVMAGPLIGYILRLPGAATIGEVLSSVVEAVIGSQFGIMAVVAGLVQGFGAELGFLLTGYRKWNWGSLSLSVLCVTVVTFLRDVIFYGYKAFPLNLLATLFLIRLCSVFIFSGLITKITTNLLEKSKILTR